MGRIWKEAVVAYFKIWSRILPGGADVNNNLKTANPWAVIWTRYLLYKKTEYQQLEREFGVCIHVYVAKISVRIPIKYPNVNNRDWKEND